jgi:RNA polymerase sigma-70 factor (ECF subfamily)
VTVAESAGDGSELIDVDFDDFYARGHRRYAAMAFALTGSVADSDDLVQEAFSTAYRRWSEVSRLDNPSAWVRKVIVNKAMSRGRRLRRELFAVTRLRNRPPSESPSVDAADAELWKFVGELPRQQAAAIALHYIEDLPIDEIAAILGCSAGAVKTHLSRGRHTLAAKLNARPEEGSDD